MSDELTIALQSLFVVALVAALAPLVVGLIPLRVPQVVILIIGGVIVGPEALDLAEPASIELLSNVGLGFLFLLAGYELELELFRQRAGKLAVVAWVASAVLAGGVVGLLAAMGLVRAFVPVALALTTTALGTLLPILRDNNMLRGSFGSYLLAGGAVGEFFPIVAIAIFLGSNGRILGLVSLLAVAVIALALSLIPRLARGGRLAQILTEGQHATAQTTLRWTVVMLLLLLLIANTFGLDAVLGAFLAGVVLRRWAPRGHPFPGGKARCGRLRLLHPNILRRLGNEPGPPLHRAITRPPRSVLRLVACRTRFADTACLSISAPAAAAVRTAVPAGDSPAPPRGAE